MQNWKNVGEFVDSKGIRFDLEITELTVPVEADHFLFAVKINETELENGKKPSFHIYKIFIKKDFCKTQDIAWSYALGLPMEEIKERLNSIQDGKIPFFFPDMSFEKGYAII